MNIAVPKEVAPGERRVALVPESVSRLTKAGNRVVVESGAGAAAGYGDAAYTAAGADMGADRKAVLAGADRLLMVKPLPEWEITSLQRGAVAIGMLRPLNSAAYMKQAAEQGVRAIAMELVPRITRAQKMDTLSSQATAAGYKAVLVAAAQHGKFFP